MASSVPTAIAGAPTLPRADISAGAHIGKYEILKRLAVGGMAEIFLARAVGLPGFEKMVVIKRILPQFAAKTDFVNMFLDEARIAATMHHPNLVQVYDAGVLDGNHFMAMEYLHGENLRGIQNAVTGGGERLPMDIAVNILVGVCAGLHHAHEKIGFDGQPLDIIHRDVTPHNVIVTYDGGVKLFDFGVVKASGRLGVTRGRTLKGKVAYMSPEQCTGEELDRRSDIFSLGIMLYEVTLGRRLFLGKSEFEVMQQIVGQPIVHPRAIDASYSPSLEAIVMRALAKKREYRYPTAVALQEVLEELAREERLHISPAALKAFMEQTFGKRAEAWHGTGRRDSAVATSGQQPVLESGIEISSGDLLALDPPAGTRPNTAVFDLMVEAEPASESELSSESESQPESALPEMNDSHGVLPSRGRFARYAIAGLVGGGVVLALIGVVWWQLDRGSVAAHVASSPSVPANAPPAPASPEVNVQLHAAPPGTTLYLDGQKLDPAAPGALQSQSPQLIDPGREHVLVLDIKVSRDSDVAPAKTIRIPSSHKTPPRWPPRYDAPKVVAAPVGDGTLILATKPECHVAVDGLSRGETPLSLKLPAGRHTVILTNAEREVNRAVPVTILPRQTLHKSFDFSQ